jgi:hypothetical protein
MRRAIWLTAAVLAAAPSLGAGEDEFRWHGRLSAGATLEVKGVNGAIEATSGAGSEAEIVAVKKSRRSDPAEVRIEVVEHAGGVTVCAVYPTPAGREPNECRPGSGGRMNTRDNDVTVDFTVQVPAGVRFVGRTVNGGVEAVSLGAEAEAYTVNGSVRIESKGHARAETVNGSIRASLGRADWTGSLKLRTVNGGITLELPSDTDAEVHAKTVNGEIESDFDLTVRGRFSRRRLTGTLGRGGRQLDLETVNGGIRLRRSS